MLHISFSFVCPERTGYVPQQVSDMAYLYVLMKIYELEIERKDGEG